METFTSTDLPHLFLLSTTLNSNFTDDDFYKYGDFNDKSSQEPSHDDNHIHVFSMVIFSVAFLLGTTGNGLVIWITGFKMKKTVNTVWFLNLAIADFIFTFFLPLSIIYIALGFHWPFGTFLCKLNSTIALLNLFASVFLLTVISIDRFFSVVLPVFSQNHRTPRLASIITLIVWLLAVLASWPYAVFRDTKSMHGNIVCFNNFFLTDDTKSDEVKARAILRHRVLVVTKFIISFCIPFIVIISCYTAIALKIHINQISTSTKPFKIILAVLISFFVCWFPYHVFCFLELSTKIQTLHRVLYIGVPITSSLAFLNSCVNPFLYVFMGRDFKETFWKSIPSIFERAFNEDSARTEIPSKTKSASESLLV